MCAVHAELLVVAELSLCVLACRDLRDASSLLSARQDDLDRARSRSVQAESKYRDLLNLAERHKKYGDSAANAAAQHGQSYEVCAVIMHSYRVLRFEARCVASAACQAVLPISRSLHHGGLNLVCGVCLFFFLFSKFYYSLHGGAV